MNLVLDLGNTYGKIAVCDHNKVVEAATYERITNREISYFHIRYGSLKGAIVSSVVNYSREIIDYLSNLFGTCIELNHSTPIPLINKYNTPDTLGYDRNASSVGAYTICPGKNVLVIDAGTAITYDIVSSKGEFLGGNISPGVEIRFKSLNKFTYRLQDLVRPADIPPLVGGSTREAIQSGVVRGLLFEMDGFIDTIGDKYPKLQVVLTGGDAKYFVGKLKNSIFVDPNLNLIGLNRILEHNAESEI
mgnify:CR=1 FL=1